MIDTQKMQIENKNFEKDSNKMQDLVYAQAIRNSVQNLNYKDEEKKMQ